MAWSLNFVGTPHAIARALTTFASNLSNGDRDDFLQVEPTLTQLVTLNAAAPQLNLAASSQGLSGGKRLGLTVMMLLSTATHVGD